MSYDLNTATSFAKLKEVEKADFIKRYSPAELATASKSEKERYLGQRRFIKIFLDLLITIRENDGVDASNSHLILDEDIVFDYADEHAFLQPQHEYVKKERLKTYSEEESETNTREVYLYKLDESHPVYPDYEEYSNLLFYHISLLTEKKVVIETLEYHWKICKSYGFDLKLLYETTRGFQLDREYDKIPTMPVNTVITEKWFNNYDHVTANLSVDKMTSTQWVIAVKFWLADLGVDSSRIDSSDLARTTHFFTGTPISEIQNSEIYRKYRRIDIQSDELSLDDLEAVRKRFFKFGLKKLAKQISQTIEQTNRSKSKI